MIIKPQYIYYIRDRVTGKIVFKGTNYEVAEKFNCKPYSVKNAFNRKTNFKGKYRVLREKL